MPDDFERRNRQRELQGREADDLTISRVESGSDGERGATIETLDASHFDRVDDAARREAGKIGDRLRGDGDTDRELTGSDAGAKYVHEHLPDRFQRVQPIAETFQRVTSAIVGIFETLKMVRIEGRERVPRDGGYLVVSNHTRFSDPVKLLALLNRPAHLVNADMHFRAGRIQRWFLNSIGAIEVESTLSNLSDEEQQELLLRVPSGAQAYYRTVITRDHDAAMRRQQIMKHRAFLKTTVATLVKGEPVVMFPEGLWLYEKEGHVLRKAYGGVEHIAREYRNVTGKDLPILPVAMSDGSARASDMMMMSTEMSIDAVMKRIAALLPEHERGYYR